MIIVVARIIALAHAIGRGLEGAKFVAISPFSARLGAGRGFSEVEEIIVDDSAWPLDERTAQILLPYGAPVNRLIGT